MRFYLRKPKIGIWGLVLILAALLAVTSQAFAFRFVVLADSPDNVSRWSEDNKGFNKECLDYINGQILKLNPKPDMVFFLGDLVTRARNAAGDRFLPKWKDVMRPLTQAGIKIYVAAGNRDFYGNSGWTEKDLEAEYQQCFGSPQDPDFNMPDNGPPSYNKLAYTVSHKNAFFVVLDSFGFYQDGQGQWQNWDNGLDTEQLNWVRDQAHQATGTFKFALSHGPAFSPQGWPVKDSVQKTMWGIMQDNHFNAFFCGHEHIYSRWLIDKSVDPTITHPLTQVLTGTAGAWPDHIYSIKVDKRKMRANTFYNYVVADVGATRVELKTYGININAGKYSVSVIDHFFLQNPRTPN